MRENADAQILLKSIHHFMTFKIRWPNNAFEKFGMTDVVTVIYVFAKYIKIVPLMFLSQSEFNFPLIFSVFFFFCIFTIILKVYSA